MVGGEALEDGFFVVVGAAGCFATLEEAGLEFDIWDIEEEDGAAFTDLFGEEFGLLDGPWKTVEEEVLFVGFVEFGFDEAHDRFVGDELTTLHGLTEGFDEVAVFAFLVFFAGGGGSAEEVAS